MSNETKKPITEADVKVGQVWVCGLPTCEHRRRVDGISGGRVRTTWLSPREGCDSVAMAEFVSYLNRDPASHLSTPGTGATDGLEARVSKVEGVLARICPEADEQTDGKGRTLVQIDREISDLCEIAQVTARRVTNLERLSAAHVPVPAKVHVRSDAASTNEAATEAAAVNQCCVCQLTGPTYQSPDGMHGWFCKAHALSGYEIREAIPSAYRIPGTTLAGCVRNLASAHDTALKVNAELSGHIGTMRGQLAAAQAATVAAEGRAETARRHAADAEAKLAALRADIENVRASLGK